LYRCNEDGPVLSLNKAKREDDEARAPGVPLLHFGHSNAWASKYLAVRGEELRREWLAKENKAGRGTVPSSASASTTSTAAAAAAAAAAAVDDPPVPFSVAFYVQAAAGDPGVAVVGLHTFTHNLKLPGFDR
jgi:hypothetical protein